MESAQEKLNNLLKIVKNKMLADNSERDPFDDDLNSHHVHLTLWTCLLIVIVFLLWAGFAYIDESTTAIGKVIPSSKIQVIQSLEGGVIKEILVHEGEIIDKNKELVVMDNTKFESDYHGGISQQDSLQAKIERITAELNGKPFTPSESLKKSIPDLIQSEMTLYNSKKSELDSIMQQKELLENEMKMTYPLIAKGSVSKVEYYQLQQQQHNLKWRIDNFRSLELKELNEAKSDLARVKENNIGMKDRLDRTTIQSPVRGIVKQIYINTIGGVVKPGMDIMEIVPLHDNLLIEARVRPADIGFLHIGQKANVRITAFDPSIYGSMYGKLEHISADTSTDAKEQSYYEVWIRTDKNYLEKKDGTKLSIIPGMQASASVITGRRSILNYLLKPILKTKYTALQER